MLQVEDLGKVSFEEAYKYQKKCVDEVKKNGKVGKLLLLEHLPCITAGVSTSSEEIESCKVQIDKLKKNIPVIKTDRGGKITAHNIGQLTGYPIINLRLAGLSIRTFIEKVLRCVQEVLSSYGLKTNLLIEKNKTGLWVGDRKICFLGIRISKFVTYHGFTLNVNNDLNIFNLFTPCGIENCKVTSLKKELQQEVSFEELKVSVGSIFARRF